MTKGVLRGAVAAGALCACLAAPLAYTLDTVRSTHSGSIPSAGPVSTSVGPGGRQPGAFGRRGFPGGGFPGGGFPGGGFPGGGFTGGGFPGGGATRGGGFAGGGAGGGLLNASTPSAATKALLEANASKYTWVAATVGSNEAAGYQLATGDPVMAIGGFNGTDPYPSLSKFEALVKEGKVHYFIAGGQGGGPGAGTSSDSSAITSWVESHFQSTSEGGVTVYNLTTPVAG
jgi:hypothetical protein